MTAPGNTLPPGPSFTVHGGFYGPELFHDLDAAIQRAKVLARDSWSSTVMVTEFRVVWPDSEASQ